MLVALTNQAVWGTVELHDDDHNIGRAARWRIINKVFQQLNFERIPSENRVIRESDIGITYENVKERALPKGIRKDLDQANRVGRRGLGGRGWDSAESYLLRTRW